MKVSVTQKDIDAGERASPDSCPVGLAVSRAARANHVSVTIPENNHDVAIIVVTKRHDLQLSFIAEQKVADFIMEFDHGKSVKPFAFELKSSFTGNFRR